MAKKFVKVNGLHNVFEASANIASSTIKSGASASVDANSILFITADADDVDLFGSDYPSMKEGAHYIWAQGMLHDTNSGMVEVTVEGGDYLNTTGSQLGVGKAHIVVNHDESGVTAGTFGMAGASSVSAGGSIVVKIPNFTVDDYGHLTAANHSNLTIGVPAAETHKKTDHKSLTIKCGSSSYTYTSLAAQTIDVDAAIDKKMTTAVVYRGKATVDLTDGATTAATSLGITGYTTAKSGDLIISKDGIKEFMWNGSIWEEVGAEGKSVVSATATQKAGYEIGKIIINGGTITFYGRGVTAANESKTGQTYKIGSITIEDVNGADQTIDFTGVDTKYGATNGVALAGGTFFQAALHSHTKFGATGVASTSASRYYRVGLDAAGKLAVNVPWQANTNTAHKHTAGTGLTCDNTTGSTSGTIKYSLNTATSSAIGGIAIGYSENGKNYPVELDTNNKAYVNVPWLNTTYGASGGVELVDSKFRATLHTWEMMGATGVASTTADRYYRVGLDAAGKLAVNVPWTDNNTNTTYTLSGAVVGTTGSAAANTSVTTAVASAVSFVDTLTPSSGTATKSTCILMNGDGSINLKAVSGKNNAIEIDYTGVATAEDWATIG